jgi:hypothetical protein
MSEQPKLAALYARRSKDDPKQVSIGSQKETCLAAARTCGYEILERLILPMKALAVPSWRDPA